MNPMECGGYAPLCCDHVRSALQELRWQPSGNLARESWQLRCRGRGGRGVAAEQELERANRLLTSQLELTQEVAIGPDAGARHEHILLIADADAHAVAGQPHELIARPNRLAC